MEKGIEAYLQPSINSYFKATMEFCACILLVVLGFQEEFVCFFFAVVAFFLALTHIISAIYKRKEFHRKFRSIQDKPDLWSDFNRGQRYFGSRMIVGDHYFFSKYAKDFFLICDIENIFVSHTRKGHLYLNAKLAVFEHPIRICALNSMGQKALNEELTALIYDLTEIDPRIQFIR